MAAGFFAKLTEGAKRLVNNAGKAVKKVGKAVAKGAKAVGKGVAKGAKWVGEHSGDIMTTAGGIMEMTGNPTLSTIGTGLRTTAPIANRLFGKQPQQNVVYEDEEDYDEDEE